MFINLFSGDRGARTQQCKSCCAVKMRISKKFLVFLSFAFTYVLICVFMNKELLAYTETNGVEVELTRRFQEKCHDNKKLNPCEVIHVAVVCVGYNATKKVYTLTKSLLFHRTNRIHLHLIADGIAYHILNELFQTWDISEFNFSLYSAENAISKVTFIPTTLYSGVNELVRLAVPQLLPTSLEKVIVLDTDITVSMNIAELWNLVSSFSDKQVIGLVENQISDWYAAKTVSGQWPAIGKGFNIGVMAFNLKNLRSLNWHALWRSVAEKYLDTDPFIHSADQVIINAVIADNPQLVYRLPCVYNIQLSDHTQAESCYSSLRDSKMIIFWNSPQKLQVKNRHRGFFKKVYTNFVKMDGYSLQHFQFHCGSNSRPFITHDLMDEEDACYEIQKSRVSKFRTHLFFFPYIADPLRRFDVTLVSQLSLDRLHMLQPLLHSWEGPISLAVYLYEAEVELFENFILESDYIRSRENVGYHIVYKQGTVHAFNLLRNIALEQVQTPFVFLSDIDFLPMPNSSAVLQQAVEDLMQTGNQKTALVVPAFENLSSQFRNLNSKEEVISSLEEGSLSPFVDHLFPLHGPTNFSFWLEAKTPYKVEYTPSFEPYIVVRKNVTRYDTRFLKYGWDKISHILELHAQNYEFIVLPNIFIVHQPHALGMDNLKFSYYEQYRGCLHSMQCELAQDLLDRYQYDMKGQFSDIKC